MTAPDTRIGPYSVVREIGRGGMGVVYLARDERLGRDVAIKALPENLATNKDLLARFEREAQSLARLNHPHVATIYGLEEHGDSLYLILEYVAGETLAERLAQGPLPVAEAVELAAQVADALAAAHEQQIIHRDVKPGNIVVNERGHAKMLDFGLAKFLPGHEPAQLDGAAGPMTHTGAVLGTFNYMSPEQARGEAVDGRTDVFALGAVLYETVTGTKSFDGKSVAEVFDAVLNRSPPSASDVNPAVPPAVARIIAKALHKDAAARHASAAELRADLRSVQHAPTASATPPAPPPPRTSLIAIVAVAVVELGVVLYLTQGGEEAAPPDRIRLAVLRFDNLGGDPAQDYFADGMADEIITALGRLRSPRLGVMGRSSSMRFEDAETLRRNLEIDFVVDGTVKRHEDTVFINIELLDANGALRWAHPFEGKLDNVPRLQREIARRIARELKVELLPDARTHYVAGAAGQERFRLGRHWLYKTGADSFEKAAREFVAATELEPHWALAHAMAARAYVFWSSWNTVPAEQLRGPARRHATEAPRLDDQLAEAHTADAMVHFILEWEIEEARRSFERALELTPDAGDVHHWYGHLLGTLGRHDEAVREFKKALELDGLSPFHRSCMSMHQIQDGRLQDADESLTRAQELAPLFALVFQNRGLWHERQGRFADATAAWQRSFTKTDIPYFRALVGYGLGREGKTAEARKVLESFEAKVAKGEYVGQLDYARVHAGLGDKDEAFRSLERAYEDKEAWLICLPFSVGYDTLHDDPRYDALLRKLGLGEG